jgi:ParB-like chromosome segregation protein Spo0J
MDAHEYASLFPTATTSELKELAADIKQRGLLHPIVLLDGKVLDGRNRWSACSMANVEPVYVQYSGTDPLADVISWNLHRRQLSVSQRAALVLRLKPLLAARARERQEKLGRTHGDTLMANLPQGSNGTARDQAAAAVGVSGRSVQDAEYVEKHDPALFEEIKAGRMSINAAKKRIRQEREPATNHRAQVKPKLQLSHRGDADRIKELAETIKTAAGELEFLCAQTKHREFARELCESSATRLQEVARYLVSVA